MKKFEGTEKECTACHKIKPVSEFYIRKNRSGTPFSICKDCHREKSKASRTPEKNYERHIKYRFKMTTEEYEILMEQQDFRCAICRKVFTNDARIDHDHVCCPGIKTCGECVRGIICQRCNALVGYLETDNGELEEAMKYLERYKRE